MPAIGVFVINRCGMAIGNIMVAIFSIQSSVNMNHYSEELYSQLSSEDNRDCIIIFIRNNGDYRSLFICMI